MINWYCNHLSDLLLIIINHQYFARIGTLKRSLYSIVFIVNNVKLLVCQHNCTK